MYKRYLQDIGVQLSGGKAPPALAVFVKAAAERGDTVLPYYGIYRLVRCLFTPNEETRARTVKGRLPAVDQGVDSVRQWKLSTEAMKQAMLNRHVSAFQGCTREGPASVWQQFGAFCDTGFGIAV
jgi:hypothetical protein